MLIYIASFVKKITIAVNARMLLKNRLDGIGSFARHTLMRLSEKHPEVDFIFLFDREAASEFKFGPNVQHIVVPPQTRHPILYHIWYQYSVRRLLQKIKPDLFLSPDGLLSLGAACRQLPVIHDLNFAHNPNDLPMSIAVYFNHFFPLSAKAAIRIATVSEFSKKDIATTYKIDPTKIDVVYNGIDPDFKPVTDSVKKEIRNKYTAGAEYLLFVGSIHTRKNVGRLLQAFEAFKTRTNSTFKLLVVGPAFWGTKELQKIQKKMHYKEDVIFTGRLGDDELKKVMASAFCLTYTPYFEGFGVPVVEAMRCGVPVISSNTSSLPEIAGRAALYFNPFDVEEITKAIIKIASDGELRNALVAEGLVQSEKFDWDKTSDLLWQSIQKALA